MQETTSHPESSMIDSTSFDQETLELIIKFKAGTSYTFNEVLTEDYQNFIEGESAGKAFNQFIRSKYQGTKLEE